MQVQYRKSRLIMGISQERLSSYGDLAKDPLDQIMGNYLWNCALSETLYQSLNWLEISLRNNICQAANQTFGNNWLTNGQLFPLEQDMVSEAIERLVKEGKNTNPPDITAALHFGFWCSLFRSEYEHKLRPLLPRVFPYFTPAALRKRGTLSHRLNNIRKFRNRIFHFEPILNYKPDIRYGEIRQTIEWMRPELISFLDINCKFNQEFAKGNSPYVIEADKILSKMIP